MHTIDAQPTIGEVGPMPVPTRVEDRMPIGPEPAAGAVLQPPPFRSRSPACLPNRTRRTRGRPSLLPIDWHGNCVPLIVPISNAVTCRPSEDLHVSAQAWLTVSA